MSSKQGFSLIELLIVLAVVVLLTTMAYPSWTSSLLRSQRVDASASLLEDQALLERCYAKNLAYNSPCTMLPVWPHLSARGFYLIDISDLSETGYTLTAAAIGTQSKDFACSRLTIRQNGEASACTPS